MLIKGKTLVNILVNDRITNSNNSLFVVTNIAIQIEPAIKTMISFSTTGKNDKKIKRSILVLDDFLELIRL